MGYKMYVMFRGNIFFQTESARQMDAAKETREKLIEMREELATKEALQARLQDEHSKLAKTVSR